MAISHTGTSRIASIDAKPRFMARDRFPVGLIQEIGAIHRQKAAKTEALLADFGLIISMTINPDSYHRGGIAIKTPYGMESLSTIHWIVKRYPVIDGGLEAIRLKVKSWNARKKALIKPRHIHKACCSHLAEQGWISARR